MSDIFGFETKTGKNFVDPEGNEGVIISNSKILLVQQWQVQYQLQVNPIYECGTSTVYFAAKHASGTFTVNRIMSENSKDIKTVFGTFCKPEEVDIKGYSGRCGSTTSVELKLIGCMLTGATFGGQAQNPYTTEDLTAQFTGLEMK